MLHLKLGRQRERVSEAKLALDEGSTDNAMAQRALDRTALEFRSASMSNCLPVLSATSLKRNTFQ